MGFHCCLCCGDWRSETINRWQLLSRGSVSHRCFQGIQHQENNECRVKELLFTMGSPTTISTQVDVECVCGLQYLDFWENQNTFGPCFPQWWHLARW